MKSVMLAMPRTGTNILWRTIRQQEAENNDFYITGEIWNKRSTKTLMDQKKPLQHKHFYNSVILSAESYTRTKLVMDKFLQEYENVCFKQFIHQNGYVIDYIRNNKDIGVVIVMRNNFIDRYCSFKTALETDIWLSTK